MRKGCQRCLVVLVILQPWHLLCGPSPQSWLILIKKLVRSLESPPTSLHMAPHTHAYHCWSLAFIGICSCRDTWPAVAPMAPKTRTLLLRENRQTAPKVMGTFTRDSALPEHLLALAKALRVCKNVPEI